MGAVDASDSEKLAALASLDANETAWDYLVRAWRRCKAQEGPLRKVSHLSRGRGCRIRRHLLVNALSVAHTSSPPPSRIPHHKNLPAAAASGKRCWTSCAG